MKIQSAIESFILCFGVGLMAVGVDGKHYALIIVGGALVGLYAGITHKE